MVSVQSNKLAMPSWVNWPGWLLLFLSIFLQIYAVFINLPFRKTYITTGFSDKLVTKGLYALVRHPGVPLFALFLLSLFLVAKSTLLLIAAPLFIFLDVTLVIIEDNFFFGRMFAGYDSYRKQTPMLVPNRQSAIAFINSLRQAKA
jgi:protein-S-isoprenylcysteine O-methyltransferase Ste14